jgi:hypothetical protein
MARIYARSPKKYNGATEKGRSAFDVENVFLKISSVLCLRYAEMRLSFFGFAPRLSEDL